MAFLGGHTILGRPRFSKRRFLLRLKFSFSYFLETASPLAWWSLSGMGRVTVCARCVRFRKLRRISCSLSPLHIFFGASSMRLWGLSGRLQTSVSSLRLTQTIPVGGDASSGYSLQFWPGPCGLGVTILWRSVYIFLRRASDSVFKFLALLQQWYPLCGQWSKDRLGGMLEDPLAATCRLSTPSSPWVALCLRVYHLFLFQACCDVAPADLMLSFSFFLCSNIVWMWLIYL